MARDKISLLLIEDNPMDAMLLKESLMGISIPLFDLTCVGTLGEAFEMLDKQRFNVILSDLGLPDSRGPNTFARLHARAPHLPIIVLTGLDDEEVAMQMVRQGAQDYLVKGEVPGELLVRALRYAIERKHIQEELRARN